MSKIWGEYRYRYISYAVFHNDDSGKGNDLRNTLLDDTGSLFDKGMTE